MSSASETEICAKALVLLGQNPIIDIDDTSVPNAVKCKAAYAICRDALLREYAWAFAITRMVLAVDATAPAFGYAYQFPLPPDCLRVLGTDTASLAYEIEGGYLMADVDAVSIRYVMQVVDTGKFDSLFTEALAVRIARELSYTILKKATVAQVMDTLFQRAIAQARLVDSIESRRNEADDAAGSSWLSARR